ncbi:potassium voltage-gated channel subfamily A member 10-like [Bolinopsis microptera]|uniref:potassium voltage-gated channel subfamily A member 10-like n=1 Tax=Bolinopsis microptera TaxID=2820187 RepID=UPI003079360D
MAFTAGLNKSATPGRSTFVLNTVKVSRDHLDENKIRVRDFTRFNVSGRVFLIRTENLNMFPDTLLGSSDKNTFWRDDLNAYYFDRNREFFVSVQQFYQLKGVFRYPSHAIEDPVVIRRELELPANSSDGFSLKAIKSVDPSQREKLYNLLNFANSSSSANVLAWVDCLLIGLSVIMLIIESEPTYKKYFAENGQEAHKFAFAANSVIMGYFTFDYVLRIIAHPSTLGIFRVTRVFKLVRRCEALLVLVRALSRTTKELLLLAAMVSLSALLLGSVMYYVEYSHEVAEACSRQGREMSMRCKFNSIPNSCWWAVITITTVGYGDMVPETFPGKIVGTIAVFLALVLIALPATIIVTKFSEEYEKGVSQVEQDDVMG